MITRSFIGAALLLMLMCSVAAEQSSSVFTLRNALARFIPGFSDKKFSTFIRLNNLENANTRDDEDDEDDEEVEKDTVPFAAHQMDASMDPMVEPNPTPISSSSVSVSPSASATVSPSPSITLVPTPTTSSSVSVSPTTVTVDRTARASVTSSPSPTLPTPTATATASASLSGSPSPTISISSTPTASSSFGSVEAIAGGGTAVPTPIGDSIGNQSPTPTSSPAISDSASPTPAISLQTSPMVSRSAFPSSSTTPSSSPGSSIIQILNTTNCRFPERNRRPRNFGVFFRLNLSRLVSARINCRIRGNLLIVRSRVNGNRRMAIIGTRMILGGGGGGASRRNSRPLKRFNRRAANRKDFTRNFRLTRIRRPARGVACCEASISVNVFIRVCRDRPIRSRECESRAVSLTRRNLRFKCRSN